MVCNIFEIGASWLFKFLNNLNSRILHNVLIDLIDQWKFELYIIRCNI